MGILNALGLMKVEDHKAETNRLLVQLEDSQQIIVDLHEIIYELRPDAEWARARKAKAAEYEASKRVRKAKVAA